MLVQEIQQGKCTMEEVHAFATMNEDVDLKSLDAYGVKVNSVVGNQMTVVIPTKRMEEFVASGLCTYIDLGYEEKPLLDKARADMGIDYIHQGINLPQGYDGSGVVVGVIDIGFEYGHPSFYDSTGSALRIKRVWQQRDTSGTPPAGFTYGSELTTQAQMLAAVTDWAEQGHGSHVAGIAAGCGAPDSAGRRYRGMAPGADIVLVATNMRDPSIVDGIRYIHRYARSVHKPCVINMSLGSLEGPHDGLGECDVMIANYLNGVDSLVVVVSAANSGDSKNHLHHAFSASDTVMRTYCSLESARTLAAYADCWGGVNDNFSLSVTLHDVTGGSYTPVDSTAVISSTVDSTYIFLLRSPNDTIDYTCTIHASPTNPRNNRPEILVTVKKDGVYNNAAAAFSLTLWSNSADVHVWSDRVNFSKNGNPQYVDGDNEYTIGGMAANGDAVISVGSYTTRTYNLSSNGAMTGLVMGDEGALSGFSSRGPTWDGRVKPDICTPGQFIASVYSTPYMPYYNNILLTDSTQWGGQTHYYCLMQGTSMSSPAMAGIVALWLQNNAALNVNAVRTLLHTTALKDRFTGDIPATGNNNWGWGKVDAFAGLQPTTAPMHYVRVVPAITQQGYVNGNGRVPQGQHTISATSFNGFAFRSWNDGNTDNPRVINVTSDTNLVAYFDTVPCDIVSQFPWELSFAENLLVCWEHYSRIGGMPWMPMMGVIVSPAMPGTGNVDNWLVSPYIIPDDNMALFYECRGSAGDSLEIVVITDAGDTVTIANEYITSQSEERQANLSAYAGQQVRFAFHHYASNPSGILMLTRGVVDYLQAIDDVENNSFVVSTSGRRIRITDAPEGRLTVHDVMGRCVVASPSANGSYDLPAAGVYLVRIGDLPARKVVVVR